MAPTKTTTLRLPVPLRDEIARLAEERGSSMLDVVTDAIHRLTTEQWWDTVHDVIDAMSPEQLASYQAEADQLDSTAGDGFHAG